MIRKLLPWIGAALLIVGAAIAVNEARAQTPCPTDPVPSSSARVCWTNATQYTDGRPIPTEGPGALKSTQVRNGACTATGAPTASSILADVPAANGSTQFDTLALGWQCFSIRHETNAGVTSAWTAWARKQLTAPVDRPKPPITVTVR